MEKKYKYLLLILIFIGSLGFFVYNYVHFYREATCTEPKTCSICGKEEGSPLGHQYGDWIVVEEPGCLDSGQRERTCIRDGHKETESISPLGHSFGDWAVVTEPDCINEGKKERACKRDGYKESESIAALGHDWQEATYDEPKTCSRCGETEGHVKGYISKDDISEEWSEDRITLGGTSEGRFRILGDPLLKCMNITIVFKLYEYTADVSGRWTLWTRDGSGNWHDSGEYYFEDVDGMTETQKIYFEFSDDIDIYAYRFCINEYKNYSWNYSFSNYILEAQVREE